jgi:hypothetical protein
VKLRDNHLASLPSRWLDLWEPEKAGFHHQGTKTPRKTKTPKFSPFLVPWCLGGKKIVFGSFPDIAWNDREACR